MQDGPVKSVKKIQQVEGTNENITNKVEISSNWDREPPIHGQYIRNTEALLVGLYDLSEDEGKLDFLNDATQLWNAKIWQYCWYIYSESFWKPSI